MIIDRSLRTVLLSLCFDIAYGMYNAVVGILFSSWWLITLGAYYIVLAVMRFSLIRIKQKASGDSELELFARRFTGILLIILTVCLTGTVILSVTDNRGTDHHEIIMITIALYAFTKVTLAVIRLVQSARQRSHVLVALRNVSLADALVSIFSLQRSMLVSFGEMQQKDVTLFNALTGTGVCIAVLTLGINLTGGKKVDMARSKIAKANEKIAEKVVGGYKKVEDTVVSGYKKVEDTVVEGYKKIEDSFVDKYLTKDGETVEEAKERLKKK